MLDRPQKADEAGEVFTVVSGIMAGAPPGSVLLNKKERY